MPAGRIGRRAAHHHAAAGVDERRAEAVLLAQQREHFVLRVTFGDAAEIEAHARFGDFREILMHDHRAPIDARHGFRERRAIG